MKTKKTISRALTLLMGILLITSSCQNSSHQEMIGILADLNKKSFSPLNSFSPEGNMAYLDSMLKIPGNEHKTPLLSAKASLLLKLGREEEAVKLYEVLASHMDFMSIERMMPDMGIAYMRLGERSNCMLNHNESSCIFPIKDGGVHLLQTGSKKAIDAYEAILANNPDDLESKWLLNVAFMTLGEYPKSVPHEFLIPGLDADTAFKVKPFKDMAAGLGLDINGKAGGVIIDDFNNDGYMDIVTSGWDLNDPMHYFQNNKDGSFSDLTEHSGLKGLTGGLNIQQTDYNNDGFKDIFVLRGAWKTGEFGRQPSSLLRNNGDGTFTDVTIPAGLLFYHPTQAAVWADFNNDGWLDVYIGTENPNALNFTNTDDKNIAMLYMNNGDGTFSEVAQDAHCNVKGFIKGVTAGDYNNDGWMDIFVSTLDGKKYLLKNKGKAGVTPDFEDVTAESGIGSNANGTFTTWFFDYNNDGWPDIMAADYRFIRPLSYYAAAAAMGKPEPQAGNIYLFRNNGNGTFTNVSKDAGLDKVVYSMGANFGDIDNDGYPDMYFGTGNPDFKSLVPNKLFKNIGGKAFADVTTSSRTGNLQKGHGVAFGDFRNTGIQDIFIEMGGAVVGDSYTSSLYVNPGQNNNNWISLKLNGVKANKAAIGSRIKLTFNENGVKRSVYKYVNSGGSFGSSPLQQEIGIGQAKSIDEIEIRWAGSQTLQHFKNIAPNQFLDITEDNSKPEVIQLKKLTYKQNLKKMPMCMPVVASSR